MHSHSEHGAIPLGQAHKKSRSVLRQNEELRKEKEKLRRPFLEYQKATSLELVLQNMARTVDPKLFNMHAHYRTEVARETKHQNKQRTLAKRHYCVFPLLSPVL